jgi:hypothetical protein
MEHFVDNFSYNGVFVNQKPGQASYKAKFKTWDLHDVGVAICECTDGVSRHIPTCQLVGFNSNNYPKHKIPTEVTEMVKKVGVHLGVSSHS